MSSHSGFHVPALRVAVCLLMTMTFSSAALAEKSSNLTSTEASSSHSTNVSTRARIDDRQVFTVGFQMADFSYNEPRMKDTGTLKGITVDYLAAVPGSTLNSGTQFGINFDYVSGDLVYNGEYMNGTPVTTRTSDSIWNLRALVAGAAETDDNIIFRYFTGLGYRSLYNTTEGKGGYRREVNYLYLPLEGSLRIGLRNGWIMGGTIEYDVFLGGHVTSYMSDVNNSFPDFTNKQDSGSGYRISADIGKSFGGFSVTLQPFWQYWTVEDSDVAPLHPGSRRGIFEPKNETTTTGANLLVQI